MALTMMEALGADAKKASLYLAGCDTAAKNEMLLGIAAALREKMPCILQQNRIDIEAAQQNGIPEVMVDRLMLNEDRIEAIAAAVEKVVGLDDPVGEIESGRVLPNGLNVVKQRVPIGVVGMIYESRPNVTVDAAVLCLKASNAVILRGGKEAYHSNKILADIMRDTLASVGFDRNCVCFVEDTTREAAAKMMRLNGYLDVLIPRGGAGLIRAVVEQATVPVIETGTGNCHVYVDASADLDMAVRIVHNAKTSRPSVCNACESLLVHSSVAGEFLPRVQEALKSHDVQMFGCGRTREILGNAVAPATEEDYAAEYLDYKISVKVVDSTQEAVAHINRYTTHHSECIVTESLRDAQLFTTCVDSAAVYVNASTRYTDGEEFGLGAEIGISTQKLHARGPMGLRELTTIKYVVHGTGQIR